MSVWPTSTSANGSNRNLCFPIISAQMGDCEAIAQSKAREQARSKSAKTAGRYVACKSDLDFSLRFLAVQHVQAG